MIYKTIMQTEVNLDIYHGDNCMGRKNYFTTYCDGDMNSENHRDDIVINVNELPPGAKIVVSYPCCPSCDLPREEIMEHSGNGVMRVIGYKDICDCGFDWYEWENNEYS